MMTTDKSIVPSASATTPSLNMGPSTPSTSNAASAADCEAADILLRKANFLVNRNKLEEAMRLYDQALALNPTSTDILNCKGICLKSMGKADAAFRCYEQALRSNPNDVDALNNCGVILKEAEKFEEAIEAYTAALVVKPDFEAARANLAVVLTDQGTKMKLAGRVHDGITLYHKALACNPSYSPAFYNLGVAYSELNELDRAIGFYQQAIAINKTYVEALNNLGVIYKNLGRTQEAAEFYERALTVQPNFGIARNNLAIALTDLGTKVKNEGHLQEGVELYKKALVYHSEYPDAYYNLGVAYGEQLLYDKAIVCYQLAAHFNPRCAEAFNNLGVIYKDRDNLEKAVQCYQQALTINPNFSQTLNNLGVIYTIVGKMDDAYQYTRRAVDVNPQYAEAYNNLGVLQRDEGYVQEAIDSYDRCLAIDPDNKNAGQNKLLALNYLVGASCESVYAAHVAWGTRFARSRVPYSRWRGSMEPNRVLRVGYVSPDWFTHSVSYFVEALLKNHDRSEFQIICYSNVVKEDRKTQRFKNMVGMDNWRNIFGLSEKQAAELIREDSVDILIELTGHTANNRLDVMALKPAPIQLTWIGYPNTTGLPTIDYRITDGIVDPVSTKQTHVESLIRLPNCFLCYTPTDEAPDVAEGPAVENGFVTFGTFNNLAKINDDVIRLWALILQQVPNSRLLVKAKPFASETVQKKFIRTFEECGIESSRLDLLPLIPMCHDHLKAYALMDISLDTFPYAGTTTTCEALFMGVPVVTLKGQDNHAHNVGVTLLSNVGLVDLIAETKDDYVRIAADLAADIPALKARRLNTRKQMLASKLCDGVTYTRGVEKEFRRIWQKYLQQSSKDVTSIK
eukprot:GILK01008158.1.p1 GENE.GILK01008158.1~~GILK01008158.1.p1  ORF type:complete len:853 (-),score=154.38 GILK01008158.1:254-2812(-)